jgi:large subunit ribosomal protein L54
MHIQTTRQQYCIQIGIKFQKAGIIRQGCISRKYRQKTQNFSVGAPSTCLADTILPGINYLKGQSPVVALADEKYPKWLWTILQPKVLEDDGPGGKFERAKRRAANRQAIKDRNFMLTQ